MGNKPSSTRLYEELAELAKANVSGPLGYKFVAQAQKRLIKSMQEKGLLSEKDAVDLEM